MESPKILETTNLSLSTLEKGLFVAEIPVPALPTDPLLVTWDSPTDPTNPYNWSATRKWTTVLLTSFGGLLTLMSGPMLAPALTTISADLHITEAEVSMALSIYVLAFAFGPMVLAPCSEVWGRRWIWIGGASWYLLWNTLCGFSQGKGLLITGRLMAGLGASAEFAVSGAITADCFSSDERGRSTAVRGFLPLLGPAVGPLISGVMIQRVSWRWLFYTMSIVAAVFIALTVLFMPETHAQTLLSRKATRLRKATGKLYYTEKDVAKLSMAARLKITTLRPAIMLCTQPVIQVAAFLMGYQFGLLYIVHSTFANMWTEKYGQSHTASGLHYFSFVIGSMAALQIEWWAVDRIWARLKARHGGVTRPENRLPLLVPGSIMIPVGLLVYGWAAEKRLHWILPDLGVAIFGCGYILSATMLSSYIIEAYLDYTASGAAASQLPRNVFAFAFPIFAPGMYDMLGYGYGNTLLAGIAIVFGIPAPYILWLYGDRLRKKGKEVR